LDEVLALMEQADDLFGDGELEAARDMYEQIVGLDSYNEAAPQRISEIDVQIRENEFSAIMSEGYALLQAGDPEQAIATFQRAAAMGINQQQAQAAVQQTETQVANAQINGLQQEITAAEASERWQDAVDAYDKVLGIDANLLFAIQGRELANQRATLNQLLVNAIEAPERLSENDVYEENLRYYFIGRDIENPGPVLREQLDELQVLLENSQVPIDIDFISDTFTEVTLLKNGNLGKFEQTSMALKPGNYVAVGRRPGFRDVREEFTVGFGQTPDSVVVQCVERVVATNR
jgi:tetratricopeptide (TPR) repeat protein